MLLALVVLFVAADAGSEWAGNSAFPGAPLDETAHLLTTLLVLWAIGGVFYERLLTPALVASVLIDADHIPGRLGAHWLSTGTPRPYSHSLATVALVVFFAVVWSRRREWLLGVVVGLLIHFWRDMTEPNNGVSLLWPVTKHSFSLPHASYLLVMAAIVAVGARRSFALARIRRADAGRSIARPTATGDGHTFDASSSPAATGGKNTAPRRASNLL
jgi:membrane-bound metal-dependent hydrolase YbcI (DUF457 family)